MRLMSDPATRPYKVRQVAVVTAIVMLSAMWALFYRAPRPSVGVALAVFVALAACLAFTMRRRLWFVADTVSQDGSSLVVRRGSTEVLVPLYDIVDVYPISLFGREGLQVSLRTPVKAFGTRVVYFPPNWQNIGGEQMDQVAIEVKKALGIVAA